MMNRQIWAPLLVLGAFVIGGLLQRYFFDAPRMDLAVAKPNEGWQLPAGVLQSDGSQGFWSSSRPLGAPPPPPPPPPVVPPPPPPLAIPAGVIVAANGQYEAIFLDPTQGEVHLKAGEAMPFGGRVIKITRSSIEWIDGQGNRFRHAMLQDAPPFSTYAQGYAPPAPPRPSN